MTETPTPADLVADLTLTEKVRLVHGAVDPEGRATGYVPGVERLNIPPLRLVDGPLGVRVPGESATAFPAPVALAATFDSALAREHGAALGRETRGAGQDALLAPGVNLIRVPHNGRNFEYLSEDPVLSATMGARVVAGIQSADVIATPKHYVANSQETHRASVSAEIGERALRECYLPSFRDAVEAGAGSVMTAYNGVDGVRMSDHRELVTGVLKGKWGFDGFIVSDWYGTEGAAATANAGLDVEMPGTSPEALHDGTEDKGDESDGGGFDDLPESIARGMPDPRTCEGFAETLANAVRDGDVPESRLNDMVVRVLRAMDGVGLLRDVDERADGAVDTPAHREHAREVAARGTVLLKNDGGALPLDDDADVAVIGPNVDEAVLGGGGSSETTPVVSTAPVEGFESRAAGDVTVRYGLPRVEGVSMFDLLAGDDGTDGDARDPDVDGAVDAAGDADAAVVFVRDAATEAMDRESLRLPGRQDELVERTAAAATRTVVVVNASGPVELPWRDAVDAVLVNWYPGQAHGDAVASVCYGDADPGGRLPVTFAPEGAYPTAVDERRFPGVDGEVSHDEGVFVGYRWFDADDDRAAGAGDAEPTYPFGHGHSYATFEYRDASVEAAPAADAERRATVTVANVSDRDGREVVQAYVRPPAVDGVDRPVRELAGFASVAVPAGEVRTVEIVLDERAFARYGESGWRVDPGEYAVEIGRSSRDARVERVVDRRDEA
ncbi:beta-glucosidase [Halorubrum ezzemoulense]|uniref:Beta-glucosidase n=1 Tax=Halorubrum ezzemoulense TaxID=337243 RepID=A0A238WZ60_HALEZ|nr:MULTISPECIES: glycoside hydrolase family 3 C-terminal domain-containing protein [Halorubrum]MDB2294424.1 glycoside hydrolase family 3 C-terminal domain-containing protein [Halorubrum ezzemoulense]TKX40397.1 glycosyl hydrolase [Halorubrum sp. CGM4_25_10-8A]TKX64533.1 glycosyl hydrolase [Halorubrum sp. GN12_10-3_MGM]SNR51740.1 beta-glucosidase [Halorubrum ezzemoulense]